MEKSNMETEVKTFSIWKKIRHSEVLFGICYCLSAIITTTIWGYLPSILTTLEKRFEVNLKAISIIFVIGELSTFSSSILLSYYGGHKNRPRVMAISLIVWSVAMVIILAPQFIFGSREIPSENLYENTSTSLADNLKLFCVEPRNSTCTKDSRGRAEATTSLVLMAFGIFASNAGAVVTKNVGASYLDDNVPAETAGLYFGFYNIGRQLGLIFGIFFASAFLSYYQDPSVDPGFGPDDNRWIGAWWMAYVVMSLWCFIVALLHTIFPKDLKLKELEKPKTSNDSNDLSKSKDIKPESIWKDFPSRCKIILKNKVFMFNAIAYSLAWFSLYGAVFTLPKTLEVMFFLNASEANAYTGYINLASSVFGLLAAGIVTKVFKPSPVKLAAYCTIAFTLNAIINFGITGIKCGNSAIKMSVSPQAQCMHNCDCDKFPFNPVCDFERDITYFSPCHANCKERHTNFKTQIYKECGCKVGNVSMEFEMAQHQVCKSDCRTQFIVYVFLVTVCYTLWASTSIMQLLISLRSVSKRDKTLGQGIGYSFVTIVSYIPVPIVFSGAIDSSCNIWNISPCGANNAFCLNYHYEPFRNSIFTLLGIAYTLAAIFSTPVCFYVREMKNFYTDL